MSSLSSSSFDVAALRGRLRPSPCPGLFRIVATGDGGVCRIKTRCGRISADQARVVADGAAQWGNGAIEATNRGNLQIRGVRPEGEEPLIAALLAAGLGPSAGGATGDGATGDGATGSACDIVGADDLRNVMIHPASGRDPREAIDCAPLADALLTALIADQSLHALSPKTAILLDGGGPAVAAEHRHDLWLSACDGPDGAPWFALGLSGSPCADAPIGYVAPQDAVAVVLAILTRYAAAVAADAGLKRFRHWTAILDRAALAADLGVAPVAPAGDAQVWTPRPRPERAALIGVHPQKQPGLRWVGGVAPLGRLTPDALRGLAAAADRYADGALTLTPWRGVLLTDLSADQASAALTALAAAGLAIDAADPLSAMVACSGTGGCASARADVQGDGRRLAAALALASHGLAPDLHLTGCPKSCAAARVADVTLAAVAPGRYDLYARDVAVGGFGRLLGAGIDVAAAAQALASQASSLRR